MPVAEETGLCAGVAEAEMVRRLGLGSGLATIHCATKVSVNAPKALVVKLGDGKGWRCAMCVAG